MVNRKYFGTDGIRGQANQVPMDAMTVLKAGMAAGYYFSRGSHRHKVVIGKDTRLSGYMIEPALTSGFIAMGMDVVLVGPLPTPAVAIITRSMRADLGVMISASHNPYHDNGIKLFGPNGLKLSDEVEAELEVLMQSDMSELLAPPRQLGRATRLDDAAGRYVEHVKHTFPKRNRLDGLKVVVDCANGAAYKLAPMILWELGAEVLPMATQPNGFNINDKCGALYPEKMGEAVRANGANVGIALDGDADRLIVCDEKGEVVDGDQIMGAIAAYWNREGKLAKSGLVTTIMSNLGLEKFLEGEGIRMVRTRVG
ncbi:MAG: phosphoglucosamine mutase, partial [Rickettsiales bacterium]|nr:phosphoglucosamine mutase [Rickettsiales bacterium]